MALSVPRLQSVLSRAVDRAEDGFRWWRTELLGMVPKRWRLRRPLLEVRLDGDRLRLVLRQRDAARSLYDGGVDPAAIAEVLRREKKLAGADIRLLLPRQDVLVRDIELPAAARHQLRKLVPFELPRQTPFVPTEACFDWRLLGESGGRLTVRLAVAEKAHIDRLLAALAACGLRPTAIHIEADDPLEPLNLLQRDRATTAIRWRAAITTALWAMVFVLLWAVATLETSNREAELALLTQELAQERKAALELETLRKDIVETQRRIDFLGDRFGYKPAAPTVATLTRILPDDTWLYQLQLQNGEVRLYGYAPDAAQVIARLERSGAFQNAQFRSSSTRRSGSDVDRFDISATILRGVKP